MELLFLGTSAGTPTRQRNLSALALQEGRDWWLVDCGEATQHQLLRTPLSLQHLQALFITHVHGDHCYGLPGLLASAGMQGRQHPLPIIAPEPIRHWLQASLALTGLQLPFELHFQAVEALAPWQDLYWQVQPVALSHRVPSFAYSFTERFPNVRLDLARLQRDGIPRGPLWGQLYRGLDPEYAGRRLHSLDYRHPARRIVVAGDNDQPGLLADICQQARVLVHEATYTEAVAARTGSRGHSTAATVARFAEAIRLPALLLTHFSPRYRHPPARYCLEDLRLEAIRHY